MPRVKRGMTSRAKHKKILERAEGHYGARHRLIKTARESMMHAQAYAYRDRRNRKRDMRALWITRINAASRLYGMPYKEWQAKYQKEATPEQKATFAKADPGH